MTADIIQVDYEQLDHITTHFNQQADAVSQMRRRVQQAMSRLQHKGWIGQGAEAFYAEMEGDILPALQRLEQALTQARQVTRQTQQTMRQAEEEAASCVREGGSAQGSTGAAIGAAPGAPAEAGAPAGTIGPPSMVPGGLSGGDRYGIVGNNFTLGDETAAPYDSLSAVANEWAVPQDWLADVSDSLNDYWSDRNTVQGPPQEWLADLKDWLTDMMGAEEPGPVADEAQAASSAGGGSGGGSGGGGGSEADNSASGQGGGAAGGAGSGTGETERSPERAVSASSAQAGSATTPTEITSPYARPQDFLGGYSSGGGSGRDAGAPTAAEGGLRYQPLSGGGAAGGDGSPGPGGAGAAPSGGGGGGASPSGGRTMGLSLGLAAVSPFAALLGKTILKDKTEN